MLEILFYTFLLSISPLGEARAGIPYGILNDLHFGWAFLIGLVANVLIYPIFMWLIDTFNKKFWHHRIYRKSVVKLCRKAKKSVGTSVEKYGFWGLMVFVMIPLPGTGAYIGTIASYVLKMERRSAFMAISLGLLISCFLMAGVTYLGNKGVALLSLN